MKKVLLFNMPEDRYEFEVANKGYNFVKTIDDLDEVLRRHLKYDSKEITEAFESAPESIEDGIDKTVIAIRAILSNIKQENDAFVNE